MKVDPYAVSGFSLLALKPGDLLAIHFPERILADRELSSLCLDNIRQVVPKGVQVMGFPDDISFSVVLAPPQEPANPVAPQDWTCPTSMKERLSKFAFTEPAIVADNDSAQVERLGKRT